MASTNFTDDDQHQQPVDPAGRGGLQRQITSKPTESTSAINRYVSPLGDNISEITAPTTAPGPATAVSGAMIRHWMRDITWGRDCHLGSRLVVARSEDPTVILGGILSPDSHRPAEARQ